MNYEYYIMEKSITMKECTFQMYLGGVQSLLKGKLSSGWQRVIYWSVTTWRRKSVGP